MPAPRSALSRSALATLAIATCLGLTAASPALAAPAAYQETYRPQVHYAPAENWMNDPNGPIYHDGRYHLFYQYNPDGNSWGNMSWGHTTSTDLVHWTEQPMAIPHDDQEMVFSGGVVLDKTNSSGFGTIADPPLVAVYTSLYKDTGKQAQSLAYSTDGGTTWTKYRGNPVLDIGATDFRDPKVFWYAPTRSWRMVVAMSTEYKVRIYSSRDLKSWKQESEFGPAGSSGGIWECPDLFPMAVDGDPSRVKWVMVVSNGGAPAGGTGGQYFIGDFDGTTFTADDTGSYTPPAGTVLQDFEGTGYSPWTTTGTAFGSGPAPGSLPGQNPVFGFTGDGLANSFHDGDATTGTLTSPAFTIDQPYLNFQVGGGKHPYVAGSGDGSAPAGQVLADFEGATYGEGWTATGSFTGDGPRELQLDGSLGEKVLDTFTTAAGGDPATGTISSPAFTIDKKYLNFLIAGGHHPATGSTPTTFNLVVDGKVVRSATGRNNGVMDWVAWDVAEYAGRTATVQVVDQATGAWGHIIVDHVVHSDEAARPKDRQTSVNLLVDGEVVRTATGGDSEALDWTSWKLADLQGKQAKIQLVDHNTHGWGHVLADRFTLAGAPAQSMVQRARWLDYGADYYAAMTFNDAPAGERVQVAWMNNWTYGNNIPTEPWRGAMTIPRELRLRTVDGKVRLVQTPVDGLSGLRSGKPAAIRNVTVADGSRPLPASGSPVEIEAVLKPGTAMTSGLDVRTGDGERTRIGYDASTGELFLDRTRSGDDSFHPDFAAVHRAPVTLDKGRLKLRIVVDESSVEVYAQDGLVTLTDQIFPDPDSTGIGLFAEGGSATLAQARVWQLDSAWPQG